MNEWLTALESRHLADLTFAEAARALRALSSAYVEHRERLSRRGAFDTAGKRAAYALFYSPLHFLTVQQIIRTLRLQERPVRHILDLGCGAGAAGAAWASELLPPPRLTGIDVHPWALTEAAFTYRTCGVRGDTRRGDAARVVIPRHVDAVIAGWTLNELSATARDYIKTELLRAAQRRVRILIVEPIATRVSPWWGEWARAFEHAGGRADEWRFRVELPDLLKRFDHAAGLRHEELTARSLFCSQKAESADS
ncbi:MAG TPA: class I SAM-dependent methyltransferase [Vicinamibacterales bacterium]|nr:class I SAM-dependent methyltransferase [Vicinamibacterales bacterium]